MRHDLCQIRIGHPTSSTTISHIGPCTRNLQYCHRLPFWNSEQDAVACGGTGAKIQVRRGGACANPRRSLRSWCWCRSWRRCWRWRRWCCYRYGFQVGIRYPSCFAAVRHIGPAAGCAVHRHSFPLGNGENDAKACGCTSSHVEVRCRCCLAGGRSGGCGRCR